MTQSDRRLLGALALMCEQYLNDSGNGLDHQCMSAGERAVQILAEHGLLKPKGRGGSWTAAGKELLTSL